MRDCFIEWPSQSYRLEPILELTGGYCPAVYMSPSQRLEAGILKSREKLVLVGLILVIGNCHLAVVVIDRTISAYAMSDSLTPLRLAWTDVID